MKKKIAMMLVVLGSCGAYAQDDSDGQSGYTDFGLYSHAVERVTDPQGPEDPEGLPIGEGVLLLLGAAGAYTFKKLSRKHG